MTARLLAIVAFVLGASLVEAGTILFDFGGKAAWKYLDDGSDQGEEWRGTAFDDSAWQSGRSPFGYREYDIHTPVNFGVGADSTGRFITTYFRHSFSADDLGGVRKLVLLLRCDDGAVVYLNGREVARQNIGRGTVTHRVTAEHDLEGYEERFYRRHLLSPELVVRGENVVAVEVHQSGPGSDDLFFDLMLKTYGEGEEPRRATWNPAAAEAVRAYYKEHYVGTGIRIPDGYVDGGRGMILDPGGSVASRREIIVVDRSKDPVLRRQLEFARSQELRDLEPLERAMRLAKQIHRRFSEEKDPVRKALADYVFLGEHAGRAVLLGRAEDGFVCRHNSLLFKLMADEAGLDVALVRGNVRFGLGVGGHAWNELHLGGGKRVIVDVTNPDTDYHFPSVGDSAAQRYLTVRDESMYKLERAPKSPAKPGSVDRKALRQVLRLPSVARRSGLYPSPKQLREALQVRASKAEVAALRAALKGDTSDAERYWRLARVHRGRGEREAATETAAKAAELYRKLSEERKDDAKPLVRLGEALTMMEDFKGAERALRRATRLAPRDWEAWAELGDAVAQGALRSLLKSATGKEPTDSWRDPEKVPTLLMMSRPARDEVARCRRLIEEAASCFDKAVEVEPEEAQAYLRRGAFRTFLEPLIDHLDRNLRDEWFGSAWPSTGPRSMSDFQRAATLSPGSSRAAMAVALAAAGAMLAHYRSVVADKTTWDVLPRACRKLLREGMERLEKLARSEPGPTAAAVVETLGFLEFFLLGDKSKAEASVRRSVAADPSRQRAWDLLCLLLVNGERFEELVSVCKERLAHGDAVGTRLLLAKTYARLDRLDEAKAQVRAALRLDSNDVTANLARAAILLKAGDDIGRSEAGAFLRRAYSGLGASPSPAEWTDYTYVTGMYYALTGEAERARQTLEAVVAYEGENPAATAALDVLGKEGKE